MNGWVYVISNKAMLGLVKVGYTTKDPELRADELNHTGSPYPYIVEYEVLIEDPYQVEQRVHRRLASFNEGKEWFRCSSEQAVAAIQTESKGAAIHENFKRAQREKAIEIRKRQEADSKKKRELVEWKRSIDEHRDAAEQQIRSRYREICESRFPERPFWNYWLGTSIVSAIAISMVAEKISDSGLFWVSVVAGGISAIFVKDYFENRTKKSKKFLDLKAEEEQKIIELREKHPKEDQNIQFHRAAPEVLSNLSGKAGPKGKDSNLRFDGEISNSNHSWIVTLLVIRVSDKGSGDSTDYRVPVYIPPSSGSHFSVSISQIPEEFTWNIREVYGFK